MTTENKWGIKTCLNDDFYDWTWDDRTPLGDLTEAVEKMVALVSAAAQEEHVEVKAATLVMEEFCGDLMISFSSGDDGGSIYLNALGGGFEARVNFAKLIQTAVDDDDPEPDDPTASLRALAKNLRDALNLVENALKPT